jgi:ppGpp synthetase/RelA/SpoT-type nucleotidyltranferase
MTKTLNRAKAEMNNSSNKKEIKIEKEDFAEKYQEIFDLYENLGKNLIGAIKILLKEDSDITFLDITTRVKSLDSSWEKVDRKKYVDPFNQIEDWCGVRIICYYPSDVEKICKILKNNFNVSKSEDTSGRLAPQEFGYRSTHLILTIKDAWLETPNYKNLANLKAEVQVRTILMHAWAEIQHKLAYKSSSQVPDEFKRKLYRLSAKFEEADEQFEELKLKIREYRDNIKLNVEKNISSFEDNELNLDTLQVLLDKFYPERAKDIERTSDLLNELQNLGISMTDLAVAAETHGKFIKEIEEYRNNAYGRSSEWIQVGAMRNALDVVNEKYFEYRTKNSIPPLGWIDIVNFGRKKIGKDEVDVRENIQPLTVRKQRAE